MSICKILQQFVTTPAGIPWVPLLGPFTQEMLLNRPLYIRASSMVKVRVCIAKAPAIADSTHNHHVFLKLHSPAQHTLARNI